ncbi:MAG: preprotein translocase, SecA subunit [Dehalococcoidia bacterium]|nr:preprotein translocase, SecA subunit [Dehalococcoidia bacterium]
MLSKVLGFLGDSNERAVKKLQPLVKEINSLEPGMERLSNEALRARTQALKARLQKSEDLEELLPEAFATVREAARRTLGQRPFDVQLMGGVVLHQGKVAEMKTGEGKTLVATLPVYLNALTGRGVHVVTVNDYLAKRDTQWMGPIYDLLGLTIGCLQHDASFLYDSTVGEENPGQARLRPVDRRDAYAADITYGTNNEFGFDYLRDNMVGNLSQRVQRELHYAIVDEVDNILIDEARTPLIISGPAEESTQLYSTFAHLVPRLRQEVDYTVDEKHRSITLVDDGIAKMEKWLNLGNLYDPGNYIYTHYIENALRAHVLYKQDRDYVVKDGEVIIVDEFTGRLMQGRRYSDGLHQAIEAKEGVKVQRESVTYATVTLQNYFRMYQKLAGMTGTAATEAEELSKIYKLEVVVIPTHKLMIREDFPDLVYATEQAKFRAIVNDLEELHKMGRPVLVGTVSIEKSELLSDMLKRRGVPCEVLNAKQHEREAVIVAQAGRPGAITVATNMAGRGTDIILGGNPIGMDLSPEQWQEAHDRVIELGGLHIVGTERHESRRIDNQLRGRSGRQGDPGSSRFYVSLEDDVMRRFGGERMKGLMEWAGLGEDVPIENRLVSKSIESAQTKVEGYHFEIRKNLVEYDDVANLHRDVIYSERHKLLEGSDLKTNVQEMIHQEISTLVSDHLSEDESEKWDVGAFMAELRTMFPLPPDLSQDGLTSMHREEIQERLLEYADTLYEERESQMGTEEMRTLERIVMQRTIDGHWVEHLTSMENLRQGIGLSAFGQRDPLVMYKHEAHEMFQGLLARIQHDIAHTIYHVSLTAQPEARTSQVLPQKETAVSAVARAHQQRAATPVGGRKVGRNDPCPCGSGKKYKRCHGTAA